MLLYVWNLQLFATCKLTCESVWPPFVSPYTSSGFANLRQLASPFGQGLRLTLTPKKTKFRVRVRARFRFFVCFRFCRSCVFRWAKISLAHFCGWTIVFLVVTKLDTPKSDYGERTGTKWLVLGLVVSVNPNPNLTLKLTSWFQSFLGDLILEYSV